MGESGEHVPVVPSFLTGVAALPRFLDGLLCADGRVRLFFGGGCDPAAVAPLGIEEVREVAGGVMVVLPGRAGVFRLPLTDGGAVVVPVAEADCAPFAGRNALLLMRVAETAAQVAEGVLYHALHHGADAALVVNRVPEDGFAKALAAELAERVVLRVVDLVLPSGKADTGPETHPYLAPDAPGKDRMEQPAADVWRAPLGEGILYEWMKWRHLSAARAVMSLEACDILPVRTKNAPQVFDLALESGIVMLAGRRVYPWRVRPGKAPAFGDHICRQFDATRGTARWACAPGRLGLEKTWRQTRVSYTNPKVALPFFRAMALRVTETTLPLAPKTSLVEDEALLALSRALGAKPVRPPASAARTVRGAGAAGGADGHRDHDEERGAVHPGMDCLSPGHRGG